jgi:tetratricopeptide (TPR) repeat protein
MNQMNTKKQWPLLMAVVTSCLITLLGNVSASAYFIQTDSSSAIESLFNHAKTYYETKQYEQAAASLERALRIDSQHPILWHNLAGIRLVQEDWQRAANLALKSNSYLVGRYEKMYKELRMRNWVVITLACEGMEDAGCARRARNRAQAAAKALGY